jgi:hypothetical protein
MALHPQDLLVLYKVVANDEKASTLAGLARGVGMSFSQMHRSIERCVESGLARRDKGPFTVNRAALLEFAIHGARYAFAVKPGAKQRGIPTAHGAPPISNEIVSPEGEAPVWPHPDGTLRGPALEPLSKYAADAALADPALYELLALQDCLRIGRARERVLAEKHLRQKLGLTHVAE